MNTNNKTPEQQRASSVIGNIFNPFPQASSPERSDPPMRLSPEISRRDFFAAFALVSLCANPEAAFQHADAMIEASEK
jgi:hypothetical protein